jgi:hypothetical protein
LLFCEAVANFVTLLHSPFSELLLTVVFFYFRRRGYRTGEWEKRDKSADEQCSCQVCPQAN